MSEKYIYDLKIKQSYHGTGGREGYIYEVFDNKGDKLGNIENLPTNCGRASIVSINDEFFRISKIYDSNVKSEIKDEVVYYELSKYEFKPNFDLGKIK